MTDRIYITIGASQVKEKGYRKYLKDFRDCDGEKGFWYYKMKNLPKRDFVWVYIVIGNKVRWRARILEVVRNPVHVDFWDGSSNEVFTGLILFDFEKLPVPQEKRKGFQGFRYGK